jgi:hypothetical protein
LACLSDGFATARRRVAQSGAQQTNNKGGGFCNSRAVIELLASVGLVAVIELLAAVELLSAAFLCGCRRNQGRNNNDRGERRGYRLSGHDVGSHSDVEWLDVL